jgi:hypothetical protein
MEDMISDRDSIMVGIENAIQELNEETVEEDKEGTTFEPFSNSDYNRA